MCYTNYVVILQFSHSFPDDPNCLCKDSNIEKLICTFIVLENKSNFELYYGIDLEATVNIGQVY